MSVGVKGESEFHKRARQETHMGKAEMIPKEKHERNIAQEFEFKRRTEEPIGILYERRKDIIKRQTER